MVSRKSPNKRILVIPDTHCPYAHRDFYRFLKAVSKSYTPDRVIMLGDEVDNHCISFHNTDPDLPFSPSSELEASIKQLSCLYDLFPDVDLIDSNHGSLVYRRQKDAGLPRSIFKSWKEILEAPTGWNWHYDLTVKMSNGQDVYFHHGISKNAIRASQQLGCCFVQGHFHTDFSCQYWATSKQLCWAVTAGCLVDKDSLAFAYAKNNLRKFILGCLMIINGIPYLIPMVLNENNRWSPS